MASRRKPSFFKVLIGDDFGEKIKIPRAFLRCFDGTVPEQCKLRFATQTWIVDIEKLHHKFYFQNGWKQFVQDNGLKGSEFLTFQYNGNSEFFVHIYGKDACKREFTVVGRDASNNLEWNSVGRIKVANKDECGDVEEEVGSDSRDEGKSDESIEILEEFPQCSKAKPKRKSSWFHNVSRIGVADSVGTSVQDDDNDDEADDFENEADDFENEADSEDTDDYEDDEEEVQSDRDDDSIEILDEFPQCSKAKTKRKLSLLHKKKNSPAKEQSSIRCASGKSSNQEVKAPKQNGIGELIARHRAGDFMTKSVNPCCLIVMSHSYVKGACVHFPHKFSYIKQLCSHINLRVGKKCWTVKIYQENKSFKLQAGWPEFVTANYLKEGDVCVFVLTETTRHVFDVTIFRATETSNCILPGARQTTGVQFKSRK